MSQIGKTTVILISGARDHPDTVTVTSALAKYVLTEAPGWVIVRHGACPGPDSVDQAVSEWVKDCEALGVIEDPMPADWDHCTPLCPPDHRIRKQPGDLFHPGRRDDYCPWAGPRRNGEMIAKDPRPDLLIAAPYLRSPGTRNCVTQAKAAGIPLRVIPALPAKKPQEALF